MKQKIIAALLAFFLGVWGIHWFYLDNQEKGKKYLIWCIVGLVLSPLFIGLIALLILAILGLVDCFNFLFMTDKEFDEKYNHIDENRNERGLLTD